MVSADDLVRCYHSPTDVWRVVETGVERDVETDGHMTWRLPSGDTLIENTERGGLFIVCDERLLRLA